MDESKLEDLLATFIARVEAGEEVTPEAFVAETGAEDTPLLQMCRAYHETDALFPQDVDAIPTRIGPYRIVRELGRGGVGFVFEARHRDRDDRPLALKVLSLASHLDPRAVERFRREGDALGRLDHPNIVRVHELGTADGNPYLVMDLVPGVPLSRLLRAARRGVGKGERGRVTLPGEGSYFERAARLVAKLARAVDLAHERSLLHRDIKPANVIVTPDGEPVLLDFGLAGDTMAATLTRTGEVVGTPQYMAPEQARGDRATVATDVYGLGTVLYELLALRPPHGRCDSRQVLGRVRDVPVEPVTRGSGAIPRELAVITTVAVAFRPARRYRTAGLLADDLEAYLAARPIAARPPPLLLRAWDRARPRWPLLVTVAAAAAVIVTLVLVTGGEPAATAPEPDPAPAYHAALVAWLDDDIDGAEARLEEVLELEPAHPEARFLKARFTGGALSESDDPVVRELLAGEAKASAGDVEGALAAYRAAVELDDGDKLLPAILLGLAAFADGRVDLAERELSFAARALTSSTGLRARLGQLQYKRKDYAEAARNLVVALDEDPDDAELWQDLARCYYYAGQFEEGIAAARRATRVIDKEGGGMALVLLGNLLLRNDRGDEALDVLREAVDRYPDSVRARYNHAYALDTLHRVFEAEAEYLEILRRDPRQVDSIAMLANIYAGANRETCEECRAFYAEHPETLAPDKAIGYAKRMLELDGGRRFDVTSTAVEFARRVGRKDDVRAILRQLIKDTSKRKAELQDADVRIENLQRGLGILAIE